MSTRYEPIEDLAPDVHVAEILGSSPDVSATEVIWSEKFETADRLRYSSIFKCGDHMVSVTATWQFAWGPPEQVLQQLEVVGRAVEMGCRSFRSD